MVLHRVLANFEMRGNLFVRIAHHDRRDNLQLALC
jgi:hypothetical protein